MKRGIDLAKELGLTYRQVYHWAQRGYVCSVSFDRDGSESLDFGPMEERILRIMAELVKFGMKPNFAAELAREHVNSRDRNSIFSIGTIGYMTIGG